MDVRTYNIKLELMQIMSDKKETDRRSSYLMYVHGASTTLSYYYYIFNQVLTLK